MQTDASLLRGTTHIATTDWVCKAYAFTRCRGPVSVGTICPQHSQPAESAGGRLPGTDRPPPQCGCSSRGPEDIIAGVQLIKTRAKCLHTAAAAVRSNKGLLHTHASMPSNLLQQVRVMRKTVSKRGCQTTTKHPSPPPPPAAYMTPTRPHRTTLPPTPLARPVTPPAYTPSCPHRLV